MFLFLACVTSFTQSAVSAEDRTPDIPETRDLAPACEHNLNPLLSGKVQALFRLTDADQRHGEL